MKTPEMVKYIISNDKFSYSSGIERDFCIQIIGNGYWIDLQENNSEVFKNSFKLEDIINRMQILKEEIFEDFKNSSRIASRLPEYKTIYSVLNKIDITTISPKSFEDDISKISQQLDTDEQRKSFFKFIAFSIFYDFDFTDYKEIVNIEKFNNKWYWNLGEWKNKNRNLVTFTTNYVTLPANGLSYIPHDERGYFLHGKILAFLEGRFYQRGFYGRADLEEFSRNPKASTAYLQIKNNSTLFDGVFGNNIDEKINYVEQNYQNYLSLYYNSLKDPQVSIKKSQYSKWIEDIINMHPYLKLLIKSLDNKCNEIWIKGMSFINDHSILDWIDSSKKIVFFYFNSEDCQVVKKIIDEKYPNINVEYRDINEQSANG